MPDHFGESGDGLQLLAHFGMDADAIEKAAKKVIGRKENIA